MRLRTRRGWRTLLGTVLVVVVSAGPAVAAWDATSSGAVAVTASDSLPSGAAPTSLTRLGRNVDVAWSQVDFRGQPLGSHSGGHYALTRSGAATGGTCAGALTPGSTASSTCRDSGLAPGTYAYAVTPRLSGWAGAASSGVSITVPNPRLSFASPSWSAGSPLEGALDAFLDGAPLTYRLGDAAAGPVLQGTLTTFPTAPSAPASTSVSVGCGPSTGTSHVVHVISGGESASAAFTADFGSVLCPSSLASSPGVTAGLAEATDTFSITFSRAIDGSSVCSSLATGGTTPGSLRATVVDGGAGNDTLVVEAPAPATAVDEACGSKAGVCLPLVPCVLPADGTVRLGTVDLGSTGYAVGGSVVFDTGTSLALDGTGTVLTLTLGASTSTTTGTASSGSVTRYVPDAGITSASGGLSASGYQTSGDRLW